ncbi:MAG: IS3 family transposase [Candidatus Aminicenantes bacterium]|nr:IS3 family transposase [Candidatus Aminicenantes bacterium]
MFEIARVHPEYGYRRTTAELRARGIHVNHKVIERLHSYWDLSVFKSIKHPKENPVRILLREAGPKINLVRSLERIDDFEVLYTDFTEIRYQKGKTKAQWMPIIDHSSKVIVGHALGENANTELALEAWEKAKFMLKRLFQKIERTIIHHDQDGLYIGHKWLYQVAVKDKVRVSYSEDGAKANVYLESFIGRFKSEKRFLFWEQEDFEASKEVIRARVRYYNRVRRHSALCRYVRPSWTLCVIL